MQIKNNPIFNTRPMTLNSNSIGIEINKALFDKISKFIIVDELHISDKGQNLLESSSDEDMLDPKNIKVAEIDPTIIFRKLSAEVSIEDLFIDSTLEYKDQLMKLAGGNDSVLKIKQLDENFITRLESKINKIAINLNSYFDSGKFLSEMYSKEPLEDLFDEDLFKENLKTSVLELKDSIMNLDNPLREDIHKKLMENPNTTELENMSFNDLKVLSKFLDEPPNFENSIDKYDINSAEKIATKEKDSNQKIEKLNLSNTIKESMYKVNKRMSDGMLKHVAYKNERDMSIYDTQEYDRMLRNLMKILYKLNLSIEEISENQGVSPKNKMLLKYLGKQQETTEKYNAIKNEKDKRENEFSNLDNNKHTIVATDSYKRIKSQYDTEMSKEDDDEEK